MEGKEKKAWRLTREVWFLMNSPDSRGFYHCHYCGILLFKEQTTLDHVLQWSKYPQVRFDISNLVPSCDPDNNKRGDMDYHIFVKRFYPRLARQGIFRPS